MAPDPNLSPWEAADVAAAAEDLAPDAQPAYATPLSEVIAEYHDGPFGGSEWLEAAVIAGHVPYLEGIVLALRARHRLYRQAILEHEAKGSIDDARRATSVRNEYRRIAALLEGFAADMDLERRLGR